MQNNPQPEKDALKEKQLQKIFEGIEDEIAILRANAKYNHTTCKIDANTLKLSTCLHRRHNQTGATS